jgi:hypothetical protein
MNGQLHGSTASSPGKETHIVIGEEDGWASGRVWTTWGGDNTKYRWYMESTAISDVIRWLYFVLKLTV